MSHDDLNEQITEQRLLESEVRANEQHARTVEILESISDAFYAVGRDYCFTYVNRRAEELWRRPRDELLGKSIWAEFPQAIGSESHRMHVTAMEERRQVQFEAISPILGRWIDVSIYPEARGGLSCYFRDVTERKRSEEAARESESRYRTLFESIDEGFCVIEMIFDDHGKPYDYLFVEVNPAFELQTGLTDVQGKRMRELSPQHEQHWFDIYGQVASSGEPVRFTNRASQIRGGVWFDVNAFGIGGNDSRKVGVLFKDITDRKRTEDEVRQLNSRLEALVAQRTQQLTQANEELEAFNYSVSHDLRAPLRGVDGFAQALVEEYSEVLDDTGRMYLQRVRSGARRMGTLIDDLLRLSRLSRSRLEREEVDLSRVALASSDLLRSRESERDVEVEITPGLRVRGDPGLLRVAVDNLLENAWKFTRDERQSRIEVGREEQDGQPVYFVRDNGAGFDERYASKLFVPFGRLHGPHQFSGTGIGLAMVQRVIHLHAGRVWGESDVGKGATFYFTLPADMGEVE